jgi:hypothetical protein
VAGSRQLKGLTRLSIVGDVGIQDFARLLTLPPCLTALDIDRDRPFTFVFLDGEGEELTSVRLGRADFRGIASDRIMPEGTRLEVTLDVPEALGRAKKVVLRRGRGD